MTNAYIRQLRMFLYDAEIRKNFILLLFKVIVLSDRWMIPLSDMMSVTIYILTTMSCFVRSSSIAFQDEI